MRGVDKVICIGMVVVLKQNQFISLATFVVLLFSFLTGFLGLVVIENDWHIALEVLWGRHI